MSLAALRLRLSSISLSCGRFGWSSCGPACSEWPVDIEIESAREGLEGELLEDRVADGRRERSRVLEKWSWFMGDGWWVHYPVERQSHRSNSRRSADQRSSSSYGLRNVQSRSGRLRDRTNQSINKSCIDRNLQPPTWLSPSCSPRPSPGSRHPALPSSRTHRHRPQLVAPTKA